VVLVAGALQLDGAITAQQQQQQPPGAPVSAGTAAQPAISRITAALDAVSDLSMALSSEADAAHAAAAAAVIPLLRLGADPAVATVIKQGLKQLYAAAREGASVPETVLEALTSSIRALAVPAACGTTITAAAAASAAASTGKKRRYGTAMAAAAAEEASKKEKVHKPPPASSDGRPDVWLDEDEGDGEWVQLGDHVFMEVDACFMRDPASFQVAAAAAATAAVDARGAFGSSTNSNSTHLVQLFRVERFEGNHSVVCRFYQNAARDLAQPLQLQRKTQELCRNKIRSILHVLQPSDSSSSSKALETLTEVEAEWLQEVQAGLCG
jgi:hypothetical protein